MSHVPTPCVYRFFDNKNELLYVGKTINPGRRFYKHKNDKPWFGDVANITIEHHPTEQAALDAEKEAIQTETPSHNIRHNGGDNAETQAPDSTDPLINMFFHTIKPCSGCEIPRIERQGQIVGSNHLGYLVTWFSWTHGYPTYIEIVDHDDVATWRFYDDAEWMNSAYQAEYSHRRCDEPTT